MKVKFIFNFLGFIHGSMHSENMYPQGIISDYSKSGML